MTSIAMPKLKGIPQLGLGTYPLRGEDVIGVPYQWRSKSGFVTSIRRKCIRSNEADVGTALRRFSLARSEIYVVTKVDPSNRALHFASSVARSMDDLRPSADLLLIHWPPSDDDFATVDRLIGHGKGEGNGERHRR